MDTSQAADQSPSQPKTETHHHDPLHELGENLGKIALVVGAAAILSGCGASADAPPQFRQIGDNVYVTNTDTYSHDWESQIATFQAQHPRLKIVDVSSVDHGSYGRTDALVLITEALPDSVR